MQQNIDFGTFPDDPDADAIRTAFQKVQTNFNELYNVTSVAAVNSVNRTPGAGIQVNSSTGNVVVSASIASVSLNSGTLNVSLVNGSLPALTKTITAPGQYLKVELPNDLTTNNFTASGWANVTGNVIGGNLNTGGQVVATGNVAGLNFNTNGVVQATGNVKGGNLTTLGAVTASGNITGANVIATAGLYSVTANVSGNANVGNIGTTGVVATGNITAGNVTGANAVVANYFTGTLTTAAQPNITSVGTLTSLTVAGAGSVNAGNLVQANYVQGTLTTAAQPNITSVGTLTSLAVTGNISGANLTGTHYGAATGLTAIPGANVTGTVANATYAVSSGTAGTVTTAAQPNITSVGTLSAVAITGNANAANFNGTFYGAGTGLTAIPGANVTGTVANATYAVSSGTAGSATTAGTVTTNAQPNITSVGTLSSVLITGNANAANFNGTFYGAGTGLTAIPGANVTGTVANATYAVSAGSSTTAGSATTAGTVTTNAQPNITSVGTLSAVAITGNANAANFNGTFYGAGTGLTAIPGANVTGTVANATYAVSSGTAGSATTAGTVTTNAQPNITSVGTLSSVLITGNANAANFNGTFYGAATGLTAIPGANVTGTVANATYAVTAGTANAVAGANVSGTVANATYAVTAGTANAVAGANVSGAVSFATTANAVAGANVSGQVTFAATAKRSSRSECNRYSC